MHSNLGPNIVIGDGIIVLCVGVSAYQVQIYLLSMYSDNVLHVVNILNDKKSSKQIVDNSLLNNLEVTTLNHSNVLGITYTI